MLGHARTLGAGLERILQRELNLAGRERVQDLPKLVAVPRRERRHRSRIRLGRGGLRWGSEHTGSRRKRRYETVGDVLENQHSVNRRKSFAIRVVSCCPGGKL